MSDYESLQSEGSRESRQDDKTSEDFVARWMAEIELASATEKDWRKDAERARNMYRAEKDGAGIKFNILFSNIQTEVPALYNSTPTPDVRTRYLDDDEPARLVSQAIERALSYSVDQYDFDGTLKQAVQDRQLAGRGQVRVRYAPYEHNGKVYQEISCEHVAWKHMRVGPATLWSDMPWVAFEHFLSRDQLMRLSPRYGGGISLDVQMGDGDRAGQKPDTAPNVFKRACVWEVWDKQTRKVLWLAKSFKAAPIRVDDDPFGLIGFYPFPEPMYAVKTSGNLTPVAPFKIIEPLVDELEEITHRIQALVRVVKWRGVRHPAIPSWESLQTAEDGELVAADGDTLSLVQAGGLDKFLWLMPIEQAIKTLQQLYVQREQIKQTIFEVSGLSDILRGQTNPNETLGAQEIKANFGSMRLQDGQRDVQRFCRDLFRIKAEMICNMFTSDNLRMMTGMKNPSRQYVEMARAQLQQLQATPMPPQMGHNGGPPINGMATPPQPPALSPDLVEASNAVPWEDILALLKSGVTRTYRIDIETDSTVRGEVRQQQEQAGTFLQGTAQFIGAMGPAIESGFMTPDVAIDLYASFARVFRLGKQAEDALSRMQQKAQEQARNPPPPQPSPDEIKLQGDMQRLEMQGKMEQQKHGLAMQAMQAKAQGDHAKTAMQLQGQQKKAEIDIAMQERQAQMDFAQQERQMQMDAVGQEQDMRFAHQKAALDQFLAEQNAWREASQPRNRQ